MYPSLNFRPDNSFLLTSTIHVFFTHTYIRPTVEKKSPASEQIQWFYFFLCCLCTRNHFLLVVQDWPCGYYKFFVRSFVVVMISFFFLLLVVVETDTYLRFIIHVNWYVVAWKTKKKRNIFTKWNEIYSLVVASNINWMSPLNHFRNAVSLLPLATNKNLSFIVFDFYISLCMNTCIYKIYWSPFLVCKMVVFSGIFMNILHRIWSAFSHLSFGWCETVRKWQLPFNFLIDKFFTHPIHIRTQHRNMKHTHIRPLLDQTYLQIYDVN